jgi:Galactose oxidase, central domain/Kelch motif
MCSFNQKVSFAIALAVQLIFYSCAEGPTVPIYENVNDPGYDAYYSNVADFSEVTGGLRFSARQNHRVLVFSNDLWLYGGYDGTNSTNEVWRSSDGDNWTKVATNAAFSSRSGHEAIVFKNSIWIIQGGGGGVILNDLWVSSDGINFSLVSAFPPFTNRWLFDAVVFNNKLFVIGGGGDYDDLNDVWSTSDGTNWTEIASVNSWQKRDSHQCVVYSNSLYLFGGSGGGYVLYDMWKTINGVSWQEVKYYDTYDISSYVVRQSPELLVAGNTLWMIGGYGNYGGGGVNYFTEYQGWLIASANAFKGRYGHQAIYWQNHIWVIGGFNGTKELNDVWKSKLIL